MSIIDHILSFLAPYECLACSKEGHLLCDQCAVRLGGFPERCYVCQKLSAGALTCPACRANSLIHAVQARTTYAGAAKELVLALKFSGARAAARKMAECMLPLPAGYHETVLVPVPTAASRVRGRGYDQAKLLARELSRLTRMPYLDCLVRTGRTRQMGNSRLQRRRQLKGAFRAAESVRVDGAHVILIDDVATTGATLEAAAAALRLRGADRISAAVFAQA